MDREDAMAMMTNRGLTYGDAVMLVASAVPEGESKVWPDNSQKEFKEWALKQLEAYRREKGTANFNLRQGHWLFGCYILRDFG